MVREYLMSKVSFEFNESQETLAVGLYTRNLMDPYFEDRNRKRLVSVQINCGSILRDIYRQSDVLSLSNNSFRVDNGLFKWEYELP